jgi:hypothetical protein
MFPRKVIVSQEMTPSIRGRHNKVTLECGHVHVLYGSRKLAKTMKCRQCPAVGSLTARPGNL